MKNPTPLVANKIKYLLKRTYPGVCFGVHSLVTARDSMIHISYGLLTNEDVPIKEVAELLSSYATKERRLYIERSHLEPIRGCADSTEKIII